MNGWPQASAAGGSVGSGLVRTRLCTFEHTLAKFAEELVIDYRVSDETWRRVAQKYSEAEMREAVATVSCYVVMAMFTRNFDIRVEAPDVFEGFQQIRPYT